MTNNELKQDCKDKAKFLLSGSDWAVLPDVGLINLSEFVTYRALLRNLVINPVVDASFPVAPEPIWS
jgi:hypothetical protein